MKHKSVFPVRLKYALFPTMEVTYIHAIVVYNTSTGRTCTVSCLLNTEGCTRVYFYVYLWIYKRLSIRSNHQFPRLYFKTRQ